MRILVVPERRITGEASDREKFEAWAGALPGLIGGPLCAPTRQHHQLRVDEQVSFVNGVCVPVDGGFLASSGL